MRRNLYSICLFLLLRASLLAQETASRQPSPEEELQAPPELKDAAEGEESPGPRGPFRLFATIRKREPSPQDARAEEPSAAPASPKPRSRRDQDTFAEFILVPIRLLQGGKEAKHPSPGTATPAKDAPVDYYVIRSGDAVFHQANFEVKWETEAVPLLSGVVGRSHGEGEKWAWVELDNGQVGLMQKKDLGVAHEGQIAAFLQTERKNLVALQSHSDLAIEIAPEDLPNAPGTATESSNTPVETMRPSAHPPASPSSSPEQMDTAPAQ